VTLYREREGKGYPPLVVKSVDFERMIQLVQEGDTAKIGAYFLGALRTLADAGANFAVMASNTPHVVFTELKERSPIPLISVMEVALEAARKRRLKRVGVLGSKFTMQGKFYSEAFLRAAIAVVPPAPPEAERIHRIYMEELVHGVVRDASRQEVMKIALEIQAQENLDGMILGGTELALLMRGHEPPGLAFLDTAQLHCARVVDEILAEPGD
jgi:aspartate racemase